MRQSGKRKMVLRTGKKGVRDNPLPLLGVPQEHQAKQPQHVTKKNIVLIYAMFSVTDLILKKAITVCL